MADIPIIFCFDERILQGAGASILSLIDAAAEATVYNVHIFHPGLSGGVMDDLRSLVANTRHSMTFHEVSADRFRAAPTNRGSWTEIVYYRLIAPDILPDIDKAIYSDVDVFFKGDLSDAYAIDLTDYSWAGVAAEANTPDVVMHRHFPENPKPLIYFSGFMVMNLERMRDEGTVERIFEAIKDFGPRLKFFDLDLMNLATDAVFRLPFRYVTLEDVYERDDVTASADYAYLKSAYSIADLEAARDDPAIVHFAGPRGKPWQRRSAPRYYRDLVRRLPRGLRKTTFRDWRKRWIGAKGRRRFPMRSAP